MADNKEALPVTAWMKLQPPYMPDFMPGSMMPEEGYLPLTDHATATAAISELRAEVERLRADAERVRADEREKAAKACDAYADELVANSQSEEDSDYKERFLVYAKHVKRCSRYIRLGDV